MSIVFYTYDWVPESVSFACAEVLEEIGRPYEVATMPEHPRSEEHRPCNPSRKSQPSAMVI
jgi:hypothetical protein